MKYATVICGLIVVLLVLLYHTGVEAEKACLAAGNSEPVCARLTL